jgi:hypothetical protein
VKNGDGANPSHEGGAVSFLRKWFGRQEPEDVPINLDVEKRKEQLLRLERALDALAAEMRADHTTQDPAWRERVNEYSMLAAEAMNLRRSTPTRENVLDLVFAVRPLFTGPIPDGMERCGPLLTICGSCCRVRKAPSSCNAR